MKRIQKITEEINKLTLHIEEKYPELYQFLDENPITIPTSEHPDMSDKVFADYLESLKDLLEHHMDTHNGKK
jgi:CDP-glycerol glycerophosphotransferase (TagB/SpsB family)